MWCQRFIYLLLYFIFDKWNKSDIEDVCLISVPICSECWKTGRSFKWEFLDLNKLESNICWCCWVVWSWNSRTCDNMSQKQRQFQSTSYKNELCNSTVKIPCILFWHFSKYVLIILNERWSICMDASVHLVVRRISTLMQYWCIRSKQYIYVLSYLQNYPRDVATNWSPSLELGLELLKHH